jgi:predicted HTH domain antitoxin
MRITIEIPNIAAQHYGTTPDIIARNLMVKAALEDYREERISEGRFAEILGISRWEAQDLLDQYHIRRPYTQAMLDEDRQNLSSIFGKK